MDEKMEAKNVARGELPLVIAFAEEADFTETATATSCYYATQPGGVKDEDKD